MISVERRWWEVQYYVGQLCLALQRAGGRPDRVRARLKKRLNSMEIKLSSDL